MFTGLIEEVGRVKSVDSSNLFINCKKILEDIKLGDSIAVNGLCLTVTKIYSSFLSFHVSKTTKQLSRFNPGDIQTGEYVNLERALTVNTRLGGHFVLGHIDGKAEIISFERKGEDSFFELLYPKNLKPFIVEKGSVTLDGISLTVSKILSRSFIVTVIPHTLNSTNLAKKRIGDFMHIEADILARYINHLFLNGGNYGQNKEIIERFSKW